MKKIQSSTRAESRGWKDFELCSLHCTVVGPPKCLSLASSSLSSSSLLPFASRLTTGGEITHCAPSGTYSDGSQYEKNLAELLAKLSSAAAAGNGSFHSGSVGAAAPDQAWGLAMCYADNNATRCQDCLREVASIGGLTGLCPDAAHSRNVSFSDTDACLLRYADAPFLGSADTDGGRWQSSFGLHVDVADMARMNTTRWRLLSQLAERTAGHNHDRPQRFAYGSLPYTDARNGSEMVYGLAQCTGDLEPSEGTSCLMYLLAVVSSGDDVTNNATRSSVWGFSCHLRYQVNDPIHVIAGPAPSPKPAVPSGAAPPPLGSKSSKAPLIAALAAAAGAVVLLVAGV